MNHREIHHYSLMTLLMEISSDTSKIVTIKTFNEFLKLSPVYPNILIVNARKEARATALGSITINLGRATIREICDLKVA